jgi:predicted  nucleic acid-binding Zn-ribbon protein
MEPDKELEQLQRIESKLSRLIQRYHLTQEALGKAQHEIRELRSVIQIKETQIKNFQNQDNITKIVNTIAADAANATELKLKINEYIREIDKCIAYLRD